MSSASTNQDDLVVLQQTLLRVEETFVYKVPPMMTSSGHRAEDWNLAKPIATCSLHVDRVDSKLLLQLFKDRPKLDGPPGATEKYLFAQCKVSLKINLSSSKELSTPKMEHWVEAVTDSSRYFVIRISDENTGREAHVGMGFRERNEALNFKMSLQDYEKTMRKEAMVDGLSSSSSADSSTLSPQDKHDTGESNDATQAIDLGVSKLSLKEGETIHVNIKGAKSKPRKKTQGGGSGPGGFLLKKPPPPTSLEGATPDDAEEQVNSTDLGCVEDSPAATQAVDATVRDSSNDDDDEWGDFEGV
mmetsp:Transcript_1826/g.2731  ORF Transcript_1826/g.2731 Transcript_1826/m.2731 type:complete len:302 (+) Transcript_1826:70-975(+)|eukprot:CAMPEP_0197251482 /NCGR_PEP_ID=MMETSP1429-20130617/57342_1 /TAXON_ID=49237 /ORGANISM="Chaetoceros  sp., Strain UNC1202" /LENGTH=301 /DNA_ID=CAMNT_0042713571 /DNA_START=1 /DNA_END=906 /DNA_ORIENTATION=+